ncbi:MAG: YgfZ/GcvT domain-containing protein [Limisphaerales bacterium]
MNPLPHHEFHDGLNASFGELSGQEIVSAYGDVADEIRFLQDGAGVIDLSFRGRVCVLGDDRASYLHGQLTQNINSIATGRGAYSALCNHKGRFESDLNVFNLENEILLDFEPGLTDLVTDRLNKNIVADDAELCDVSPHFGLISVQGPKSTEVVSKLGLDLEVPADSREIVWTEDATLGQVYLARFDRLNTTGFDLYIAQESVPAIADKLIAAAKELGGGPVGWNAFESARIAAGIPRFGQDMTDANLVPEAGIADAAVSYKKGCYIGQEILNRLHTFAEVSKQLRVLDFSEGCPEVGAEIQHGDKRVGKITSVGASRALGLVHKSAFEAEALNIGDLRGKQSAVAVVP